MLSHKSPIVYLDTNFIIRNAFKLTIKFKLCDCTKIFILALSWEIEFRGATPFSEVTSFYLVDEISNVSRMGCC